MTTTRRPPPPAAVFFVLMLPFGISSGFVSVTLAFLLAKGGMPTAAVAAIIAYSVWPQTWKVFWAPVVDTSLNAKAWYAIGAILTALTIPLMSVLPPTLAAAPLLTAIVVVSSLASTLVAMAAQLFMAYGVPLERKGAVSGWSQAGNLGGAGLGGGLGLYLSQHIAAQWVSGGVLAVVCAACCAPLLVMDQPERPFRTPKYLEALKDVVRDVWSVSRSRIGFLALVLVALPIGTGAASNVWPAIAGEWRVGPDVLALVAGVAGGLASLVGAVAAGFVCDRMDRRTAYCVFGLALAAVTAAMALLPRSPAVFVILTLVYALLLGACYAGYSAVVLEAIGQGAAATKCNLMASVSNIPIAVMIGADGVVHDRFGSAGMLYFEAAAAVAAVLAMAALAWLTRGRDRPTAPAASEA